MKTLNVKIPEEQYAEVEEIVEAHHYPSKAEFIRELLRKEIRAHVKHLHRKAENRDEFTPLEDFMEEEGIE